MKKTKDQTNETQPDSQQLLSSINQTVHNLTKPAFEGISEEAKQLSPNEALVLAIAQCENVAADKFNPHFKSKYFGLGDLLAEVKPVFRKYGLTILQTPYTSETRIALKTEVLHFSGHRFDFGELGIKSEGQNLQQLGSITTYLRRYAISTIAGVSSDTDLDDDGNSATGKSYPAPAYAPKPASKPVQSGSGATIYGIVPTAKVAESVTNGSGKWWESIGLTSVAQIKSAEAILWKKGWLNEGELLEFLPDDKVAMLTGNPKMTQAFLEAVNNG